jgi:hypothetical protein
MDGKARVGVYDLGARPDTLPDRLTKLCGMLGSGHDSERASAALKADQLLRRHGLRWPDVIRAPSSPSPTGHHLRRGHEPAQINRRAVAYLAACSADVVTNWELSFCRQLTRHRSIGPKQLGILHGLVDNCRAFPGRVQ